MRIECSMLSRRRGESGAYHCLVENPPLELYLPDGLNTKGKGSGVSLPQENTLLQLAQAILLQARDQDPVKMIFR